MNFLALIGLLSLLLLILLPSSKLIRDLIKTVTVGFAAQPHISPKSIESANRSFEPGENVSLSWSPEAVLVLGDI